MSNVVKYEYIPRNERCRFCKTRKATKLCDFENGLLFDAPNNKGIRTPVQIGQCSAMMCDKCSTRIMHDKDICPNCIKELKKQIKLEEE